MTAVPLSERPRGRYGIDAIWVPWMWGIFAVGCGIGAATSFNAPPPFSFIQFSYLTVLTIVFAIGCILYLRATLRGKFEVWNDALNALQLRGDEQALDIGCGRGAVSIMLAQRLPRGHVTGIDLWHSRDQSGNSTANAEANLAANGVADRVTFVTGDMTELPFADASFDVATASLAIHNVHKTGGRNAALSEALRVLKPGGRLVIVDISATAQYVELLSELPADDVERTPLGWRVWWSGPWMSTSRVTAIRR